MKKLSDLRERCWPGYKSVKGKKAYSPGSCVKEDLRKWFDKDHPEGGWKRINSKGEAIGPCAREPGEPKPKCMSNEKRAKLSKKERASAVASKRKHDPNPERKGGPINVSNFGKGKISENMENLEEKNVPTSPEKWAQAKSQAKAKFDVYPSAYANGWAAKKYKEMGGGWKSVSEDVNEQHADVGRFEPVKPHNVKNVAGVSPRRTSDSAIVKLKEAKDKREYGYEGDMALNQLATLIRCGEMIKDILKPDTDMPEWVQSKITLATDYIQTAADYMYSEMKEEVVSEMDVGTAAALIGGTMAVGTYAGHKIGTKVGEYLNNREKKKEYARIAAGRIEDRKKRDDRMKKQVKEETIEEGRPSQRHPLEGHEYHKKSDEALIHIAKDAHKAAEAMKSHNTTAENKYRDQANDSATVRYFRQKNGMPEWYKKKYGHVNEEVEQIDEISSKLANSYLAKKHDRDYEKTSANTYKTKNPMSMAQAQKSMTSTARALKRTKTNEEVESIEEAEDIHSHRVGDEVILKNKDYHGVIVKSKGSDISFKNKSDNKHYKATHSMIDRNVSQENRYKERSDVKNKKFDDAMASDMKRIDKSGALKKFGIGVKEQVADAPFDPPYSKKPASQTDKSGAVHGPMSTAKHLARMAAAKQTRNLANPTPTSKKSDIVREAMRDAKKRDEEKKEEKKVNNSGKDKFQSDPELNSQIIRTE